MWTVKPSKPAEFGPKAYKIMGPLMTDVCQVGLEASKNFSWKRTEIAGIGVGAVREEDVSGFYCFFPNRSVKILTLLTNFRRFFV